MDNPETLTTLGTHDTGERQKINTENHNTTQKIKMISNTGPI